MNFTAETIVLSAIFLLPGYAAHRLAGSFSRAPQRGASTFDIVLTSLGITIGILVVEGLLATLIAGAVFLARGDLLNRLELDILLRSGLTEYAIERPWVVILTAVTTVPVTALAAYLMGLHDPFSRILEARQLRKNIAPYDIWVMALKQDRDRLGCRHAFVSVRLKQSRDVFEGWVVGFSLPKGDNEPRDIYLRHVTYIAGGTSTPVAYHVGSRQSAAVISSENIESITILYS